MNPCELNAAIAAVTNILYTNLSKEDFLFLNIFFSELSKSMFAMEALRSICYFEKLEEKVEKLEEEVEELEEEIS